MIEENYMLVVSFVGKVSYLINSWGLFVKMKGSEKSCKCFNVVYVGFELFLKLEVILNV